MKVLKFIIKNTPEKYFFQYPAYNNIFPIKRSAIQKKFVFFNVFVLHIYVYRIILYWEKFKDYTLNEIKKKLIGYTLKNKIIKF